jgi:sulfur-oxidizing protein SoxX
MKHTPLILGTLGAAALLVVGCASTPSPADLDAQATAMMKSSFTDKGIAKASRLDRDGVQAACSQELPPPADVSRRLEAAEMATVKWPAGGNYIGDWKVGEKLAQNGKGMTWKDKTTDPAKNGAQCYNCHQVSKEEISFGTIGPSLYNYGKLRGVKDLNDPAAAPIIQYTWGKLWNAKAYSACSNMPRFGHMGLLNEEQIRHVMALLLDPASPVNQ